MILHLALSKFAPLHKITPHEAIRILLENNLPFSHAIHTVNFSPELFQSEITVIDPREYKEVAQIVNKLIPEAAVSATREGRIAVAFHVSSIQDWMDCMMRNV